ncbi:MAG: hypothetical protein O3B87_02110 [bacterium]|nr:hypothetical protein [bacterium]
MEKHSTSSHPFWSGFALGLISGGIIIATFTTKKGRATLQKILDHSGDLELNIENLLAFIQSDSKANKKKV